MTVARSFCGGVEISYVLPILWMTSHLHIMGHMDIHMDYGGMSIPLQRVASLHRRAQANAYWLCPVPTRRRVPRLDESIVQGVPGRSLRRTVAW